MKTENGLDLVDLTNLEVDFDIEKIINGNLRKINKALMVQTAGGTANKLTLAIEDMPEYAAGIKLTFIAGASNGAAGTTININGLGEKPLYKANTTDAPNIVAGKAYDIWYNGTSFFLKASAEGNAVAANVLAGKTFSNDADTGLNGSMVDRGSVGTQTLVSEAAEYVIQEGYHNGLGKVKVAITGLIAGVIKAGTTVGGVLGTFTADATATASQVLNGATAYVNGAKITGTMVNRAGDNTNIASSIAGTTLKLRPPTGFFDGVDDTVTITDADFIAANIKNGVDLFGMVGTMPIGKNYATGTITLNDSCLYWTGSNTNGAINITTLSFVPKVVVAKAIDGAYGSCHAYANWHGMKGTRYYMNGSYNMEVALYTVVNGGKDSHYATANNVQISMLYNSSNLLGNGYSSTVQWWAWD